MKTPTDIEYLIKKTKELATSREDLIDRLAERIETDIENAEEILKELRSTLAEIRGGETKVATKVTRATSKVSAKVSAKVSGKVSGKRIRLSALQSAGMQTKILAAKFPKEGGTMKDIAKATGPIPFGSLRRIVNDLLDKKKLTKTGQKAQTRYFIA